MRKTKMVSTKPQPIKSGAVTRKAGAVKKIGTVLTTVLLALGLALVAAVVVVPQARGGASLIIETGSMLPTIHPGDLVTVRAVEPKQLSIGDIITYATSEKLVTHRIVGFDGYGASRLIITQGDNNNVEDPPVYPGQVRGVVDYTIPKIGLVLPWLGLHKFWILGGAGAAWLASWFVETYQKMRAEQAEKRQAAANPPVAPSYGPPDPALVNAVATVLAALPGAPLGLGTNSENQAVIFDNIAKNAPGFLGSPAATLVRTRTAVTAFSEPIQITSEPGKGRRIAPLTVVHTPSLTAAYKDPITVSAATAGNVNLAAEGTLGLAPDGGLVPDGESMAMGQALAQKLCTESEPSTEPEPSTEIETTSVPVEIAA